MMLRLTLLSARDTSRSTQERRQDLLPLNFPDEALCDYWGGAVVGGVFSWASRAAFLTTHDRTCGCSRRGVWADRSLRSAGRPATRRSTAQALGVSDHSAPDGESRTSTPRSVRVVRTMSASA